MRDERPPAMRRVRVRLSATELAVAVVVIVVVCLVVADAPTVVGRFWALVSGAAT